MTAPAPAVAKKDQEVLPEVTVPTNPALLVFPQDPWGFTSELKKAVLKAAGSVDAQTDKHTLLLDTLDLLSAHIRARFDTDAAAKEVRKEQSRQAYAERHNRRRHNWVERADA